MTHYLSTKLGLRSFRLSSLNFALAMVIVSTPSWSFETWRSNYASGYIGDWYNVLCGGQGGTCPCPGYAPGTCRGSVVGQFPQPPDCSGRFHLCPFEDAQHGKCCPSLPGGRAGYALRVELRNGDVWPGGGTRDQLSGVQEAPNTLTWWTQGDTRYFAWSTLLDPVSFDHFDCGTTSCTQNPWHTLTQFHQEGNCYSPPIEFALQKSVAQPGKYKMIFNTRVSYDNLDSSNRLQYVWDPVPLFSAGSQVMWHDFVLRVTFGTGNGPSDPLSGIVELWYGQNGGPKSQLTLLCPNASGTPTSVATCYTTTLYTWPNPNPCPFDPPMPGGTPMNDRFDQGLYRHPDILTSEFVYHSDVIIGTTLADVMRP